MGALRVRSASTADWVAYVLACVPGALLAFVYAIDLIPERVALALFVPSFIGLNLAHMASAWGHAYLDDGGWRAAPFDRLIVPVVVVAGSIALETVGFGVLLLTAQYWLSIHHATMQNYGILRASQRRAGRSLSERALRLDRAACVLLPLGAIAYRARAVCNEYDGVAVPAPPSWLAVLLLASGAAALCTYLVRELVAALKGEPVDALGVCLVVLTNVLWSALIVGVSHPALPLYALASGHYVQQLYFVWRFESRRSGFEGLPAAVRGFVAPPARIGYVAALMAIGAVVVMALTLGVVGARATATLLGVRPLGALEIPPWLAAMIGVNLSHYWLESRIWRSKSSSVVSAQATA